MVHFEDAGSILDAPLETVWKYRVSDLHGRAHHARARNFELLETGGGPALVSAERLLDGRWKRFVSRSADYPPLCIVNEEVEGEFAGTKFVLLYRPVGQRTRVDVIGDVQSPTFSPEVAKGKFLETLAEAYEDDVVGIRQLLDGATAAPSA
jgi:hypothetical protein